MGKTNLHLNIAIDSELLEEAEDIFNELGMDLATAVQMFIHKSVQEKGIPFDVKVSKSELDTFHNILEAMCIINDIISSDLDALLDEDSDEDKEVTVA